MFSKDKKIKWNKLEPKYVYIVEEKNKPMDRIEYLLQCTDDLEEHKLYLTTKEITRIENYRDKLEEKS